MNRGGHNFTEAAVRHLGLVLLGTLWAGIGLADDCPTLRGLATNGVNVSAIGDVRQFYSQWFYEAEENRYVAYYFFLSDKTANLYQRQIVLFYDLPGQRDFMYFYNVEKGRYWGRCATPANPAFNASRPNWNLFTHDGWGPPERRVPKIPGANDREIASPPTPPGIVPHKRVPPPVGLND